MQGRRTFTQRSSSPEQSGGGSSFESPARIDRRIFGSEERGHVVVELRRKQPQEVLSPIPQDVFGYVPENELKLDAKLFATCLRSAPCGSSPGPGGCSHEMLKVCLTDSDTLQLLTAAAEDFARAKTPAGRI